MAFDYGESKPPYRSTTAIIGATGDYLSPTTQAHGLEAILPAPQIATTIPVGRASNGSAYAFDHATPSHRGKEDVLKLRNILGPAREEFRHRLAHTGIMGSATRSDHQGPEPTGAQQHRLNVHENIPNDGRVTGYVPTTNDDEEVAPGRSPTGSLMTDNRTRSERQRHSGVSAALDTPEGGHFKRREGNGEPPPAWTELKTKAGKDRKRLPLACIACRRKKIRCSGEKPACKHCLRSRIPCVYKVTARKPAPRTDYMAMLDKRLKRMEERVIGLIPTQSPGRGSSTKRAALKAGPSFSQSNASGSKKRSAKEAFGADIDQWAKKDVPAPSADNVNQQTRISLEGYDLMADGADSLPAQEMQCHLAELFFDFVYGQSYFLLHKPSFMRQLRSGTVPPVLLLAICGVSARFSCHPDLSTEPAFLRGERWISVARDIALKRYGTPDLTILIVYLILGLHEFGTCQGGRSWMFGGMAQRMAYALLLHKETHPDSSTRTKEGGEDENFTEQEIRRRVMWACFTMDRFNSSGTDRPTFAPEQYIRTRLPIKESYFQMEITGPTEDLEGHVSVQTSLETVQSRDPSGNLGVAAYMIRSIAIWGRLVQYMNLGGKEKDNHPMWSSLSNFQRLKAQVECFIHSRPTWLVYNDLNLKNHASEKLANQFIFFHIICQQIILFMNRFALPSIASSRPPKDVPADFMSKAAQAAVEAANHISILVRDAMDYNVVAPFAGYSAFFSSIVHIQRTFSNSPKIEALAKEHLAHNISFLGRMKRYWGMFHFMAENLRDLYRQHVDSAMHGHGRGAFAAKKGSANVFQYGDWFDRYPHGVSRNDYESPSSSPVQTDGARPAKSMDRKAEAQTVEEFFSSLSTPTVNQHQEIATKKQKHEDPAPPHPGETNAITTPKEPGYADMQTLAPEQRFLPQGPALLNNTASASYQDQTYHQNQLPAGSFAPAIGGLSDTQPDVVAQQTYDAMGPPAAADTLLAVNSDSAADIHSGGDNFWQYGYGGAAGNFFADPTAVWFMPFNVNPPDISDDAGFSSATGLFSGYQWFPQQPTEGQAVENGQAAFAGNSTMRPLSQIVSSRQESTGGISSSQPSIIEGMFMR